MGLLKQLARYAKEMDCSGMEWRVFDWNAQAIAFYHSIGAFIRGSLLLVQMDKETYCDLAE